MIDTETMVLSTQLRKRRNFLIGSVGKAAWPRKFLHDFVVNKSNF